MNKDTKKLIGIVAIGVIAYELWKRQQFAGQGQGQGFQANPMSVIPVWGQQLSNATTTETSTSETSIIDSLMQIPQGPGGTSNYYGGGPGYFGGAACILPPGA